MQPHGEDLEVQKEPRPGAPEVSSGARIWAAGFFQAVQFLTVLPVPPDFTRTPGARQGDATLAASLPWFPLVGALIGCTLMVVDWLSGFILQPGIRSVVLLATLALLTGGLHLDGFIDCCDGLFNGRSIERRLEIMRDSRVGAYGVVGGTMLILAQYSALSTLSGGARMLALLAAPLLGRWSMVFAVVCYPYRRANGVGTAFRGSGRHLAGASAAGAVLLLTASFIVSHGVVSGASCAVLMVLLSLTVSTAWTRWARLRLGGGLTGDTYGALNELVTLLVFVAMPIVLQFSLRW